MSYRNLTIQPLRSMLRNAFTRAAAGALGAAAPLAVLANPTGGQVVGGTATIGSAGANGVIVTQGSQRAVINWQQFSVGSGQYVQFIQPNSSAVVLNRVTGSNPSNIFGDIIANGQVFLVNTNGVYFAPGASIDVQGLVASTLDLNDADFMQGRYVFSRAPGAPDAGVVNDGAIRAGAGGYVVLAGDYASNGGAIVAQTGRVYLAAGNAATLTFDNNGLISYVVDGKTLSRLASVTNTGQIAANGGLVVMTADVANALTATAVNNSGLITAHSVTVHGGEIVLEAQGGDIENNGTLDASANVSGVAGGDIIIRGNGATRISSGAVVETQGDHAQGGFIELSGHGLSVRGLVDAGRGGTILLDPSKIKLVSGGSVTNFSTSTVSVGTAYVLDKLNSGQNVTLVASNSIGRASNVTALDVNTRPGSGAGNLSIKTGTLITGGGGSFQNSGCALNGVCVPGTGVTLIPGSGTINLSGMNINIRGTFTADAVAGNVSLSKVVAAGGIFISGGDITAGSLIASAGNVSITGVNQPVSATNINETGLIQGKNVTIKENLGTASYGGSINVGNVTATAGGILIQAQVTGARANIHTINLMATKSIVVQQGGHSGSISVGSLSAGSNGASSHLGVRLQTVLTGVSAAGGNINAGNITATGGVQINAQGNSHSGANVRVINIDGRYISVNATARHGADISTGTLTATGAGSSKDISLFAHANGTGTSHAYNASSGGNIRVTGNITGNGKLNMDALGGVDSGGNIHVSGTVNMAGKATFLAVNEGSFGGTVSIGGAVTAKFVDITARANWGGSSLRGPNSNGAHINITGNVTATGTAPGGSPSEGVNLRAGTASFSNGNPSITVHGKVTASHGAVNIFVDGKQGTRSITIGNGSAGSGSIKAQHIHVGVQGSGSGGNIDVGNITTLGSGFSGNASIQTTGNGGSVHIDVHGIITVAGSGLFISNHGNAAFRSVSISGAIHMTGVSGNVNIFASNSAIGGGAAVNLSTVTANGRVAASVNGHGSGGAVLTLGNVNAGSISLDAVNHNGGSAAINAGNLTAPQIRVDAAANASGGQAAHITLGSINAVTTTSDALVVINATGKADTISTGKVTLSGHALASFGEVGPHPVGALFQVTTHGGASDSINIGGTVKVTALGTVGSNALGDAVVEIGAFAGSSSTPPVANAPVNIAGNVTVNAARDVSLFIHGSASGALAVTAGRDIGEVVPGLAINVSGAALKAGNNINLAAGSLSIGTGTAPGIAGDTGITTNPVNAAFVAGGTVNLGSLKGSAGYVLFKVGSLGTVGSATLGSGALVQLTSTTDTGTIGVGTGTGTTVFSAADIAAFSAYNVVIGDSTHTGTMTVGTANLGTTGITLVNNGAIKSSGLLTAGALILRAGAGTVTLTADVASTDIVSGANVGVNDTAFGGSASLSIASTGVGNVSFAFGAGKTTLAGGQVTISGALTLSAKGILDLSSDSIHAGGGVSLTAGQHILLGNTTIKAGGAFNANAHGSISDGGSGGIITAKGATFKAGTGNVVLDGETLNIGTSKLAFSAAGSVALNSAHVHAGSMTVAAAGNLNMTSASLHAASMQAVTGGSIDLSGATVVVTGAMKLTAGLVAANQPLAAKDIVLSGVSITVGTLSAAAGGTIHNGGTSGTITANGLALTAGKDITLSSTQITVGSGHVASIGSDPLLLQALANANLSPASRQPNAYFSAGGTLTLGKFTLNGSYLYMQAANITLLGPISTPASSVIQIAPVIGTNTIGVEQDPGTGSDLDLSNSLILSLFPGTTLVIGNGAESGAVTLGSNGAFDIGSSNLIIDTSGTVTGLNLVTSTGLISTVESLLASALPPPTPDQIDPNSNNNNNEAGKHRQQGDYDPNAGGTAGGTISQSTDTGGACH